MDYLTKTANNGLDVDLLNAMRLLEHGYNMSTKPEQTMPEELYNALAFAQANDIGHWILSQEWQQAVSEYVVELIGVTHWWG